MSEREVERQNSEQEAREKARRNTSKVAYMAGKRRERVWTDASKEAYRASERTEGRRGETPQKRQAWERPRKSCTGRVGSSIGRRER